MRKDCPDCGTRLVEHDICPNCQEELYINDFQMSALDEPVPVSSEWRTKVQGQRQDLKRRKQQ